MYWLVGAGLGALGGLAAEAVEVYAFVRKMGRPPWDKRAGQGGKLIDGVRYPPLRIFLLGVVLRGFIAAVVVGIYATDRQVSGPVGALSLGVGASAVITRAAESKDVGVVPGPAERTHDSRAANTSSKEKPPPEGGS